MGDVKGLLGTLQDRKRAAGLDVVAEATTESEFDDDLLIQDEDIAPARSTEQDEIDKALASVDIITAYNRWCSKGTIGGNQRRTEGIKVRCPNPVHVDNDPSAWLNTEKNLWACGGCEFTGGDIFDIAAWHFGYSVPGYKTEFHELKKKMAEDLGYSVKKTPTGKSYLEKSVPEPTVDDRPPHDDTPNPKPEVEGSLLSKLRSRLPADDISSKGTETQNATPKTSKIAPVISIVPRPDIDGDAEPVTPSLDWRDLVDSGTFMYEWMKASQHDDLPEEYYFWLGLMGVGLAVGNLLGLADNPPVKGNLFVVLYGSTGIGKSRSINNLASVLRLAFPGSDPTEGVYHVPSPGSAEALIDSFSYMQEDEDGSKFAMPVKGLVKFDELSTLMGRADRQGSAMKPTLMEFYDSYNPVTHKTRGHGEVTAINHFASCVTTTQPRAIRSLLTQTDADAGFVNRWVFATGTPKKPIAFGRPSLDYGKAVPLLSGINQWAADHHMMSISDHRKTSTGLNWTPIDMEPDALETWSDFFYDVLVPRKTEDIEGSSALLSRTDLTMKKLIALLAFDRHHTAVQERDVVDAISIWSYLERSYAGLSREIGVGIYEDCRRFISEAIKGHKARTSKAPSARDLLRIIDGRFNAGLVRSVLETMVSMGEVNEILVEAKNGTKTPRYVYVE